MKRALGALTPWDTFYRMTELESLNAHGVEEEKDEDEDGGGNRTGDGHQLDDGEDQPGTQMKIKEENGSSVISR
jgi:hypothetical protein